jgi:amino acid permease
MKHQMKQERRFIHKMKSNMNKIIISFTIVSVIAIISIMVCCLAALGYNSKVSIEKEKIEVDAQSNFNQNNP